MTRLRCISRFPLRKFATFPLFAIGAQLLGGCLFFPILADEEDANAGSADTRLAEKQSEQLARMRNNPNVSAEEYEAINSRLGRPNALPPRPNSADALERRLDAEERAAND